MGYGTIASNGATHGSKSQTDKSLQTQKFMHIARGSTILPMTEAIETFNKIQVCNHMPEGEF